jgi:dUTP pyrophosphatase
MFINDNLLRFYPKYMHLRICANLAYGELYNRYYEAIHNHNTKINQNPIHIDAGFDLFTPQELDFTGSDINKLNFGIKCSAQIVERDIVNGNVRTYNTGYYLHPRSSIYKTPLRLANSTGIIDSGYRGPITGMFDCMQNHFCAHQHDRLVQICAPGLIPIFVELVENEDKLGVETVRGEGGFGSTGL